MKDKIKQKNSLSSFHVNYPSNCLTTYQELAFGIKMKKSVEEPSFKNPCSVQFIYNLKASNRKTVRTSHSEHTLVKYEQNDLNKKKAHDRITAQPPHTHYSRQGFNRPINVDSSPNKKNLYHSKPRFESFNSVYNLLLHVKPRRLTIKEIRSLNVSEKFVNDASKMLFYPKHLSFSPRVFNLK